MCVTAWERCKTFHPNGTDKFIVRNANAIAKSQLACARLLDESGDMLQISTESNLGDPKEREVLWQEV